MRRAATSAATAAVVLVGLGCATGFETPSIVVDLRYLAVRADPPEVVLDVDLEDPVLPEIPPVLVRALVADPAAERRLAWRMTACPRTRSGRCAPDAVRVPLGEGIAEDPESPAGFVAVGELRATLPLLEDALSADDLAGFGGIAVQVVVEVRPEGTAEGDPETIYAAKRVVYAPRLPPTREANHNPSILVLRARGEVFAGGRCARPDTVPLPVAPGEEVTLVPVETPGAREVYVLPTLDGGAQEFRENLRYSWFATAGAFTRERTGGPVDPFTGPPPLDTVWIAPSAEAVAELPSRRIPLWVVQRDERGGASWLERCFEVTGP